MRKLYFLFLFLSAIPICLTAQDQKTIRGRVTDVQSGGALEGVSVSVNTSGTRSAVTSDASGNYIINVPVTATQLVFTFVGMKEVVENINNRATINVNMVSVNSDMGRSSSSGLRFKKKRKHLPAR